MGCADSYVADADAPAFVGTRCQVVNLLADLNEEITKRHGSDF